MTTFLFQNFSKKKRRKLCEKFAISFYDLLESEKITEINANNQVLREFNVYVFTGTDVKSRCQKIQNLKNTKMSDFEIKSSWSKSRLTSNSLRIALG